MIIAYKNPFLYGNLARIGDLLSFRRTTPLFWRGDCRRGGLVGLVLAKPIEYVFQNPPWRLTTRRAAGGRQFVRGAAAIGEDRGRSLVEQQTEKVDAENWGKLGCNRMGYDRNHDNSHRELSTG
jgi:hypothetical protein